MTPPIRKFVAYYRVSTERQGDSGLGLDAQKRAVRGYVESVNGKLLGEFEDVISGSVKDRPALNEAIAVARSKSGELVVKGLDRLSREGVSFAGRMKDLRLAYVDCESPNDDNLIKTIKLSMAEAELDKIRKRTKAAFASMDETIKRDGGYMSKAGNWMTELGRKDLTKYCGNRGAINSAKAKTKMAQENENNKKAIAMTVNLLKHGVSFTQILKSLNEGGFKTSRENDFKLKTLTILYDAHLKYTGQPPRKIRRRGERRVEEGKRPAKRIKK